jgi:hypothetical protein
VKESLRLGVRCKHTRGRLSLPAGSFHLAIVPDVVALPSLQPLLSSAKNRGERTSKRSITYATCLVLPRLVLQFFILIENVGDDDCLIEREVVKPAKKFVVKKATMNFRTRFYDSSSWSPDRPSLTAQRLDQATTSSATLLFKISMSSNTGSILNTS